MEQEREFYILWCTMLSGYAESYFAKMPDRVLETKYLELIEELGEEIERG